MKLTIKLSFLFLFVTIISFSECRSLKDSRRKFDLTRILKCLLMNEDCEKETYSRQNDPLTEVISSIIMLNGVVYTVDGTDWHLNPKEAIVVYNEKIKYVGSNDEARKYIIPWNSQVYDLGGGVVFPGFHDVHMHPLEAMSPVAGACILPNLTPPDDQKVTNALNECKDKTVIGTDWVLGAGHSVTSLLEYVKKGESPKLLLDKFIKDRPAAMLEETSHSAWVNSKALEMAKITSETPEKPGGVIMREPDSNKPNGILFENAAIEIFALAMDPCKGNNNQLICQLNNEGLFNSMEELKSYGITSFCDARVYWKLGHDYSYEDACKNEYLTTRTVLGLWAYPNANDADQISNLKSLYWNPSPNNECSLRKTQIKVYMDGIVESTTAAMEKNYLVNLSLPIISKENIGMNYFDKNRLTTYLKELQELGNENEGFDFHIHAIGDRGIKDALDAIEEAKQYLKVRKPRHRLTHLEIVDPTDISRFVKLDVIADFQVAGDFTLPSEHQHLAQYVGETKDKFSIPVKDVLKTGAKTTFSSDWDVSTLNPFVGVQHAARRGDQSVTIKEAIEMYTVNPAFAMRQEDRVGFLSEGMEADLIVIDQDIFNIHKEKIKYTQVLQTIFMGESIYSSKGNHNFIETLTSDLDVLKNKSLLEWCWNLADWSDICYSLCESVNIDGLNDEDMKRVMTYFCYP
ncbi:putative amidohydrolase YtcJ [Ruditapes philippinarum]|uniref:putative amidohydrolase YtcJ n=1 Tax=Ruditapes philippinarum TaxID=129788 RepID=UPI00295BB53D|nr:putative amidohydrolase YtcJ [Ruditapes philippinarum]